MKKYEILNRNNGVVSFIFSVRRKVRNGGDSMELYSCTTALKGTHQKISSPLFS